MLHFYSANQSANTILKIILNFWLEKILIILLCVPPFLFSQYKIGLDIDLTVHNVLGEVIFSEKLTEFSEDYNKPLYTIT